MTQSAEAQILTAARQSILSKSAELAQMDAAVLQRVADALRPALNGQAASLEALIAAPGDSSELLASLPLPELHRLYEGLETYFREHFPPQKAAPAIPAVQSLALLDFDSEDDEEEFSLLDFDAAADDKGALRRPLWLLAQLIAACSYIRQAAAV